MARKPTSDLRPEMGSATSQLRIVGPAAGRRRAGYQFGLEATLIFAADLTVAQIEQLQADPLLAVLEEPAPAPAEPVDPAT